MLLQTDRLSSQFPLRPLSVLVFHLLLTPSCRGQFQLVGPPLPIVATLGHDVVLPCHLEPEMDVSADMLEWAKLNLDPRFVNVWRAASGPASPPVISLSGLDGQTGGVVLQCESAGWYPEPEVLWLDAEGKLLSAGPPETVRGPDDLYTVSSRVTVEKRHSNSFTCRVQHHNTNRTTQTHLQVPDDFFIVPSSCSAPVAVSVLFGLMFVIAVVLLVWKWRQNINETKTNPTDVEGEEKNRSKTKDQFGTDEERGQLMKPDTVHTEDLKREGGHKSKQRNTSEEKRRRREAEKEVQTLKEEVQTLKEELQTKKREVESKQSELQDLLSEKERKEKELQSLKEDLEKKSRELETIQRSINKPYSFTSKKAKQKKDEAEQEVKTLQKHLKTKQEETELNIKEFEDRRAEVQKLQDEVQGMEASLQTLMGDLESSNMEVHLSA
ncbi:butyrophilin subfamily 2 member A1-like isoform X2 [Eleginops maclovinus]|uniref:butyrophilin subfamily 2 member A1-like isoform X2 n=1 Tax=Eleginops maclovinus TaxID=56733 RepID=UPI0030803616